MQDDVYIGIDPGAKGSICLLFPYLHEAIFIATTDKPKEILEKLEEVKREYDVRVIMIEDVHAIHGSAAGSSFSFGYNVGVVNTIAVASGISTDRVTPKKWQKTVGVRAKGPAIKQDVASICDRLYPNVTIRGIRGGLHDGKSDSLMIAHYAYLKYNNLKIETKE